LLDSAACVNVELLHGAKAALRQGGDALLQLLQARGEVQQPERCQAQPCSLPQWALVAGAVYVIIVPLFDLTIALAAQGEALMASICCETYIEMFSIRL
jgi:hypothetical protein